MSDALLVPSLLPEQSRRAPAEPSRAGTDELPARLLQAADADADALADRLHDGALQALVVARYAADLAVRGGDPALVREAVQDALLALRREVWQLRPRTAEGLGHALTALSAQRVEAGGAPLDLGLDADLPDAGLSADGCALAYRLVQAAAAEPGPVRVGLSRSGSTTTVTVTTPVPDAPLDPVTWDARARALGGRYDPPEPGSRTARLLLPVPAPPACAPKPEGDR